MWSLSLGNLKDGRFSTLKEILLYNMNTKTYLINTQNSEMYNSKINTSLPLLIPSQQTSFFILYLKPNLGTSTLVSLSLTDLHQNDTSSKAIDWALILISFSAFIYFLKSAKDSLSLSLAFFSVIWLGFSFISVININFLYFSYFDMELIYPALWMIVSQCLMMSFIFVKDNNKDFSLSLLWGITSASFIINLAGIIMLKSMPDIAIYFIYIPVIFILITIMIITWATSLNQSRIAYTHIANTCFFLFVLLAWGTLLNFHLVPQNSSTLIFLSAILISTILISIFSYIPIQKEKNSIQAEPEDAFNDAQIGSKQSSMILEAKEKSEHRRLMQVIEQERKLMSDLQVKTAQQNEDMRKSKEAADEANRAKSAFLAVVSHEIRTPMTGIMGMLRLLQDTQLSKDQKDYASTIKDSGDAMLALLNDILDFEKIESGKMDLESINFDLKRLVRSVHTLMRGHAEAKNVQLVLEVDPNLPNWVYGDPTRLRQVLLNLINNAIKFTTKGSVYLRIRDLSGENNKEKMHQIYFAVQDSGIGIGIESQRKLFMPFAQADKSISRKYGGTGLGLAICKRLIEAMGGAISINSKEGEGSTFFFTVSMTEGNEIDEDGNENITQSDTLLPKNIALKSALSVLIVDDNGINQKVVSGFVEKCGAKTMMAGNGADAIALHTQNSFDLIFLDIELPDMSGIDVTHKIRSMALAQKANIPIIALTGNTSDDDIKEYLKAGMNDFTAKPVSFEKIVEILHKIETVNLQGKDDLLISVEANLILEEDSENEDKSPESYVSPLAAYAAQKNSNKQNPFLNDSNDTQEDDEDSFEIAVRQFEEAEKLSLLDSSSKSDARSEMQFAGLDETMLISLKSGLSIEQIQEILVSFYEKADELIADIGNAYLSEDAISLNARAHELKGMAGNFGFSELAQMCGTIEKAGKENQLNTCKTEVMHLGDKYAVARSTLNKWLTRQ